MPDLNQLRGEVKAGRASVESAARALAGEKARLRALQAQAGDLARRFDGENPQHVEARDALARAVAASGKRIDALGRERASARDGLAGLYGQLEPLTDPRKAIGGLDAQYPILLFPMRLEARFVTVTRDGVEARELLVRVYPDDCLVDSFEPDLSDGEVKNARRYWCSVWAAGGDEGLQRAAWRELCAAHGAGRALYLTKQYAPLPGSDAVPLRSNGNEVILAIALDAPLVAAEHGPVTDYWIAAWRAGRNNTAVTAAFNALSGLVGAARADEVRRLLVPFNIGDRPQAGVDRATAAVSVTFVVLPPAATAAAKHQAWTRPPVAALLPDRFLLVADSGTEHVELLGNVIAQPLAVGPDPLAPQSEQFDNASGDLSVPAQLLWMTDFDTAVAAGMAFRVPLTPRQSAQGFDRLYVIGLRLTSDHDEGRAELEALLGHHAQSQSGLALVPQGTPTNNSEQGSSGWTRIQEADDLFHLARLAQTGQSQFDATATAAYDKRDGLVLAEALGIDAAVLQDVANADGTDQAESRAMNAALWPATLGYWMDTQMSPVFGADTIERTRRHFIDRVTGRGGIPAVRIGKQPYGVLATTALSRMQWRDALLLHLRDLLDKVAQAHWDALAADVPRVGRAAANPQQELLDIIGLHPSSVEFHLNVVDSADRLWNHAQFFPWLRARLAAQLADQMRAGMQLLDSLGYQGPQPEIVSKFFAYVHGPMTRPVVDTPPLSETQTLTVCTDDGKNYIEWCRNRAKTAFDDLRLQNGFSAGKTPDAMLYHVLRHALQLGYHHVAVGLHEENGLLDAAALSRAYSEPAFVHIADHAADQPSESRYQLLYARPTAITGLAGRTVAEFIPLWLPIAGANSVLADQIEALGVLEHADTASLERAFAEHIDLCSYRFDAWVLSLANERLHRMRHPGGDDEPRRQGVYLGAFGWIEGLQPDAAVLAAPQLGDEAKKLFERPGDAALVRDPANGGHVLAPSLNHAVTAAVLRSGYLRNATPSAPSLLAVDLSSSRVRIALDFIEGIRNGQSLGALLGYQLERRLHDRHAEAEMDRFIYQIRKAFPLAAKRIADSVDADAGSAAIQSVEARNVCDGMLLLEHVRTSAVKTYPWGKDLEGANPTEQAIIDQEVSALFEIQDAVADVAVAESIHQVTTGNTERGAAAMDAYSKGGFPPEPDVVTTPRTGLSLTHRVGLHLPVDAVAAAGATPRAQSEPALDRWAAGILPAPADIVVRVTATNAPPGSAAVDLTVTMQALGLGPIDLLYVVDPGSDAAMGELDDRILHHVVAGNGLSPDASVMIRYTARVPGKKTVFEVTPLIANLRSILLNSRPLKPSDAALQNEAVQGGDDATTVPMAQVTAAQTNLTNVRNGAATLLAAGGLDSLAQEATPIATIVAGVDAAFDAFAALQLQAGLCGITLAGMGPVLRARGDWFALARRNAKKVLARWQDKLDACDAQRTIGADPANSDLMRIDALVKAEREISTAYTDPIPATPGPLAAIVDTKRLAFTTAMGAVDAVRVSGATTLGALWTAWSATFAGRPAIDLTQDDTSEEEKGLRLLAGDMQRLVASLRDEAGKRLTKAGKLVTDSAAAGGNARAELLMEADKALLGDGFRMIPRFTLAVDQRDEWQNAFDGRAAQMAHLAADHDFPVDDWMYGVARVRPKMHDLETTIELAEAFGTAEPVLEPAQFPYDAAEPWLAMELPAAYDLTKATDHLLYTASYPGGAFDKNAASFGGLLVDEWTEVIPSTRETAALAFNYDRPSHEPPQAMLLVTPATLAPSWNWGDLALAIPETFELAKKRAVEPRDVAATPLARLLPATLMAFTTHAISISSELRPATVAVAAAMVQHG